MASAMGRAVNDVVLRVWTPRGATVELLKQTAPDLEDLTTRRVTVEDLIGEYPIGAWGDETRDYHLRISVPARDVGDRVLAARISLVVAGAVAAEGRMTAVWTDDEAMSTRLNAEVAHATGQAELADAIQGGIDAWERGDDANATRLLGRAAQLAAEAGDDARLEELQRIVDVDVATGTTRLRSDARRLDVMSLDTGSTKTVRRAPSPVTPP
jgi:hypothetical protein